MFANPNISQTPSILVNLFFLCGPFSLLPLSDFFLVSAYGHERLPIEEPFFSFEGGLVLKIAIFLPSL
jgi:hypothetical protein